MPALEKLRLTLITDRSVSSLPPMQVVHRALEGGVTTVQLREKDLDSRNMYFLASELRNMTNDYGANLIINDRVDIALAVGADGVHMGKNSMPIMDARRLLGRDRLIGFSAHNMQEAVGAEENGVNYITISPIYQSPGKGRPIGPAAVATMKVCLKIPVIALGGINEDNVDDVLGNKADGVAVVSAIMASDDPRAASERLRRKLDLCGQIT
ncbi:MAG: thiamine phosphate synthase [Candidatus Brocadiales bacterium]|nr:thiamine phosphate synthase [Candidatus Bathyanammoxibius amoris]